MGYCKDRASSRKLHWRHAAGMQRATDRGSSTEKPRLPQEGTGLLDMDLVKMQAKRAKEEPPTVAFLRGIFAGRAPEADADFSD